MTLSIGLNGMTLLAIWLILMGIQQFGAPYPRWLVYIMGALAVIAGLLFIVGH
jgi:uncharacterized membrane protein YphA (DoxX/SURF4 family)